MKATRLQKAALLFSVVAGAFLAFTTQHTPALVLLSEPHAHDRLVRNAPEEVSAMLDIPLARVEAMDRRIEARTQSQLKHGVHAMMLAANVTDMSTCHGKSKGCEPLAKNILAVAAEIEKECADKYFDTPAFEQCEADIAKPLCDQSAADFPHMCDPFSTGYTVDGGYVGGEKPANVNGEFCKACQRIKAGYGCFAEHSTVIKRGSAAPVPLSSVHAGDEILGVSASGRGEWTRVLYA
eukprot:CAMPEP_0172060872 /NCGR_PEP_ID=MMETSP1043-20130122/8186_1 /TAXON_ID=464988 /ORGANISM="Hemiselmis andersenii, Strain CCMP441" /LENGTH=237 /DNA_ID=CAMNT_0012720647 /DNA_START=13 /DNA_END=722 /DNA_ORIENTATION=-